MALLNENRNRVPQVAVLPVTGDNNGIRGQMRMVDGATDGVIAVCTVGDDVVSRIAATITLNTDLILTAVVPGSTGNDITLEVVDVVSTVGAVVTEGATPNNIVVTLDAANVANTNQTIIDAINASAFAKKLVVASGAGTTDAIAIAETNLAAGASSAVWLGLLAL